MLQALLFGLSTITGSAEVLLAMAAILAVALVVVDQQPLGPVAHVAALAGHDDETQVLGDPGLLVLLREDLALLQAAGMAPSSFPIRGTPFFRATLGFGWPNELGMFLALSLPFAVYVLVAALWLTVSEARVAPRR